MKMSDMCVQNTETGFLTNCRLCFNESNFPVLSIFDEKYKNDDLQRKIMLLTNILVSFLLIYFSALSRKMRPFLIFLCL